MMNTKALFFAASLLSIPPGAQTRGDEYTALPQVAAMQGAVLENGGLALPDRMPVQVTQSFIVLEAESFVSAEPQTGHGASGTVVPAGGAGDEPRYIDFTEQAEYQFVVTTAGTYNLSFRLWLPFQASWDFRAQVDDQEEYKVDVSPAEPKRWFLRLEGSVFLSVGTHRLKIRRLYSGKRLDQIIIAPNWVNWPSADWPNSLPWIAYNPKACSATPQRQIDRGACMFEKVQPPSVLRWGQMRFAGPFGGVNVDGVKVEVSGDGGINWQVLPDGDLSRLPCKGDGRDSLYLRVSLQRNADGTAPLVPLPSLTYQANRRRLIILQDKASRLTFDRGSGGLLLMENLTLKRQYNPGDAVMPGFSLFIKKPMQEGRWIGPGEITSRGVRTMGSPPSQIECQYDAPALQILVHSKITGMGQGLYRWSIEVTNNGDFDILQLRYPDFTSLQVANESQREVLLWPENTGTFYRPALKAGSQQTHYPGRAGIGYVDLFTNEGGFYCAIFDPLMRLAEINTAANAMNGRMGFFFDYRDRIRPDTRATYQGEFAVHTGDWHWAADRYRERFYTLYRKPDYPQWLKNCDGYLVRYLPRQPFDQVLSFLDDAQELGLNFIYLTHGFTVGNRYYAPVPALGGEDGVIKVGQEIHRRGGKWGRYFHGGSYDPFFATADSFFGIPRNSIPENQRPPDWDWLVRNCWYEKENQQFEKPQPGSLKDESDWGMDFQPPSDFPNYLRFWSIDRFAKTYGMDLAYYDGFPLWSQTHVDFNPYLGHHGEGRGGYARVEFLKKNLQMVRPVSPGFVQDHEGVNDLFEQYAFAMNSGFMVDQDNEIYRYTHPEHIIFGGQQNGWWWTPKMERATDRAFLYGFRFDIVSWNRYVVEVLRLRQMLSRWFNGSRFMDTLGLSLNDSSLKAFVFRRNGGRGFLITTYNPEKRSGGVVTFDIGKYPGERTISSAYLFEAGCDPRPLSFTYRGNCVEFPISSDSISAVLMLHESSEEEIMMTVCQMKMDDRRLGLQCKLFNTGPRSAQVRLVIEAATTTFEHSNPRFAVPARRGVTRLIPYLTCIMREPVCVKAFVRDREVASARCGANPTQQGVFPTLKSQMASTDQVPP